MKSLVSLQFTVTVEDSFAVVSMVLWHCRLELIYSCQPAELSARCRRVSRFPHSAFSALRQLVVLGEFTYEAVFCFRQYGVRKSAK